MMLLYFDEVKYDPPNQNSYWLGGIALQAEHVPAVETRLNEICAETLGSALLSKETELHGIELVRGKGNFKHHQFEERMAVLERLLEIFQIEPIRKVWVKIIPENMLQTEKSPADTGFMYLVEKANSLFRFNETVGMMFGDYDEPVIGSSVASLSRFRQGGTDWRMGEEIEHIVDTVHFAKSHHSRMIQLADVMLYCLQFREAEAIANWRKAVKEVIENSGLHHGCLNKTWPTTRHWHR